jgi:hypothetical protein
MGRSTSHKSITNEKTLTRFVCGGISPSGQTQRALSKFLSQALTILVLLAVRYGQKSQDGEPDAPTTNRSLGFAGDIVPRRVRGWSIHWRFGGAFFIRLGSA